MASKTVKTSKQFVVNCKCEGQNSIISINHKVVIKKAKLLCIEISVRVMRSKQIHANIVQIVRSDDCD